MVELYYNVQSDNGTLTDGSSIASQESVARLLTAPPRVDHALRRWSDLYLESHEGLKDLRVPLRLPAMMREAGFVDVQNQMIQLYTCAWSSSGLPTSKEWLLYLLMQL